MTIWTATGGGGGGESHRVVIDSQGASSKRWPTIKIRGHIIKTTFHPIKKYYSPVADRKTGTTDCSAMHAMPPHGGSLAGDLH